MEQENKFRIEHDSMGEVRVPCDRYWGAQTQRSKENFPIGAGLETMPREITHAFGILKQAAANANHILNPEKMSEEKRAVIVRDTGLADAHHVVAVFAPGGQAIDHAYRITTSTRRIYQMEAADFPN